jgi:hypothetical protein
MKAMLRMTINPIVGMSGFDVQYADDDSKVRTVVDRYRTFNRQHKRPEQRNIVRQYLNTGEECILTAPYADTWFSVRCPSLLIRQVLHDPLNFQEPIAILLQSSFLDGKLYLYKTITNEDRLSEPARIIRKTIPYSCWYWANFEHDEPEPVSGLLYEDRVAPNLAALGKQYGFNPLDWLQYQRRGEPAFATWSDFFTHLADTLWAMLDKIKSYGAFHTVWQVETGEDDVTASIAKVQEWQQAVFKNGVAPEMNSHLWVGENVDVKPLTYPMQSTDIEKILNVMLQVTGMSGNIAPYDLGANANQAQATSKEQGSPQEHFQIAVQGDVEDMFLDQYVYVTEDAITKGRISRNDVKDVNPLTYGMEITSPEISKKDKGAQAETCKTAVEVMGVLLQQGLHDERTIANGEAKLVQELLGVDIETLSDEEIAALRMPAEPEPALPPGIEGPALPVPDTEEPDEEDAV